MMCYLVRKGSRGFQGKVHGHEYLGVGEMGTGNRIKRNQLKKIKRGFGGTHSGNTTRTKGYDEVGPLPLKARGDKAYL